MINSILLDPEDLEQHPNVSWFKSVPEEDVMDLIFNEFGEYSSDESLSGYQRDWLLALKQNPNIPICLYVGNPDAIEASIVIKYNDSNNTYVFGYVDASAVKFGPIGGDGDGDEDDPPSTSGFGPEMADELIEKLLRKKAKESKNDPDAIAARLLLS